MQNLPYTSESIQYTYGELLYIREVIVSCVMNLGTVDLTQNPKNVEKEQNCGVIEGNIVERFISNVRRTVTYTVGNSASNFRFLKIERHDSKAKIVTGDEK